MSAFSVILLLLSAISVRGCGVSDLDKSIKALVTLFEDRLANNSRSVKPLYGTLRGI